MQGQPKTWTLAFRDAELESEFQIYSARANAFQHRVVWTLVTLSIALSVFATRSSANSAGNFRLALAVRFGIQVPLFALIALLGWSTPRTLARFRGIAGVAGSMALLCGFIVFALFAPNPQGWPFRETLVSLTITIVMACALLATRFVNALAAVVPSVVGLLGVIAWRHPQPDMPSLAFWISCACALGMLVAWKIEESQRSAFVASRRSEQLLRNVLPAAIAERLKQDPARIAEHFDEVTVLFGDIAGFTPLSAEMAPADLVAALDEIFSRFDEIAHRHGLEKIKTIGDAYMVVSGAPMPRADHAEAIAEMALEMRDAIASNRFAGGRPLKMRIGIHSGPVVAGVIGKQRFIYDLWGDTVNTASRMESHGVEGLVQVSEATAARLRDRFALTERGLVQVKGKGEMRTWFLDGKKAE